MAAGYGNPPIEHRFKKGQSGNPKGRPKGEGVFPVKNTSLGSVLVKMLNQHEIAGKSIPEGMTVWEYLCQQVIVRALNGDRYMIQALLDRFAPATLLAKIEVAEKPEEIEATANYTVEETREIVSILKEIGFNAEQSSETTQAQPAQTAS